MDEIDLSAKGVGDLGQLKMGEDEFNARVNKYDQDSGLGQNASELNFGDEPEQSFIDFGDDSLVKEKKSERQKSAHTLKNS